MPDTPKTDPSLFNPPATSASGGGGGGGQGRQGRAQLVTQPAFAKQIRNTSSPMGVNIALQRGYMIWAQARPKYTGGPLNDGRDMINFMFNPATVTSDYNLNPNSSTAAAMDYMVPGDMGTIAPTPLQQTVSWDLYFDRTYELNYGGNSSAPNDPAVIGVQADVYQFLQFTGVTDSGNFNYSNTLSAINSAASLKGQNAGNGLANQVLGSLRSGGIMQFIPCNVFFGSASDQMNQNSSSTNFNAIGSQLSYYGVITEFTVQYTHWTSSMVPMKCVISVNFMMLANTNATQQAAVWRDLQKLQLAPATVQAPYSIGYTPPSAITGSTWTTGG